MKHRLPSGGANVDDHPVVLEPSRRSRAGNKPEHPFGFVPVERVDLAKRCDVMLGNDEQVNRGFRGDVSNGKEPVGALDNVSRKLAAHDLAEDALLRQRRSPPP
jgi:hypothetical protein